LKIEEDFNYLLKEKEQHSSIKQQQISIESFKKTRYKRNKNTDSRNRNEDKKSQHDLITKLKNQLNQHYNSSPCPYWLNILLIENSHDYIINKYNTLSHQIAQIFLQWTKSKDNNNKQDQLNDDLKICALCVASKNNLFLLEPIVQAYKLNCESNHKLLLPFVDEIIKTKKTKDSFKDKAAIIGELSLQSYFDSEQVIEIFFN
jgi:hypothetical protein